MIAALVPVLGVAYWGTLSSVVSRWQSDPQYSHGYLVPVIAVGLLWMQRNGLQTALIRPAGWGLGLVALGLVLRHAATHFYLSWFEQLSLIPCLLGVVALAGGTEAVRWSWTSIGFLAFMIPLPFWLETSLREPLRTVATLTSTFALQTVGIRAVADGHIINVGSIPLGVAEACSGLRMLMVFFALSTAVALSTHRPLWEKAVIGLSAVPIAILANTLRISATGILYALHYDRFAEFVFHDVAGWLMMPLALLLLWAEVSCLRRLFLEEEVRPLADVTSTCSPRRPVPV